MFAIKFILSLALLASSAFAGAPGVDAAVSLCQTTQGNSANSIIVPEGTQYATGATGAPAYRTLTAATQAGAQFIPFFDGTTFSATPFGTSASKQFYEACICLSLLAPANAVNFQLGISVGVPALGNSAPTTPLYQSGLVTVTTISIPASTITATNPMWCTPNFPMVIPVSSYPFVNDQTGAIQHSIFMVGKYQ